jgi:hypothetical protein
LVALALQKTARALQKTAAQQKPATSSASDSAALKPPSLTKQAQHPTVKRHLDLFFTHIFSLLLLGHESLETTMIYTHVARKGPAGVPSPLDLLGEVAAADVQAAVEVTRLLAGA